MYRIFIGINLEKSASGWFLVRTKNGELSFFPSFISTSRMDSMCSSEVLIAPHCHTMSAPLPPKKGEEITENYRSIL